MSVRIPTYRLHKGSGQALVQINGERIYLGKYDTEQSRESYRRLVAESLGCPRTSPRLLLQENQIAEKLSIGKLIVAYWEFAETYYQRDGKPTSELGCMHDALMPLRQLYSHTSATEFGPRSLKTVRQAMLEANLCRGVINNRIRRIKRVFKWGVAEELIPASVYHALQAVPGLRKGRTTAREPEPVHPVADKVVEATLPYLPAVIADMVQLQRLTGCRPSEACIIRPCDVDRSKDIWNYRPASHKTQYRDRERVIFVGPKAQAILRKYLLRAPDLYCFSPAESERSRNSERRVNRKSPMTPSQTRRRRKKSPQRQPRNRYDRVSYRRAIQRAVDQANRKRMEAAEEAGVVAELLSRWSPNQLRHAAGTEVRRRFGVEAAQVVLGHAQADVTQVYAERDYELAKRIMREVG